MLLIQPIEQLSALVRSDANYVSSCSANAAASKSSASQHGELSHHYQAVNIRLVLVIDRAQYVWPFSAFPCHKAAMQTHSKTTMQELHKHIPNSQEIWNALSPVAHGCETSRVPAAISRFDGEATEECKETRSI